MIGNVLDKLKLWFSGKLIKQYLGSTVRKILIALATLIAVNVPYLQPIADAINNNLDGIAAGITASIFALISLLWGYTQKVKTDSQKEK